jgi:hypothetical protein
MRPTGHTLRTAALAASLLTLTMAAPAHANLWAKYKLACPLAVVAQDDPLTAPGDPGAADHNHGASGSDQFSASMTTGAMLAGSTTCFLRENHSSYWAPTMDKDGVSYGAGFSTYYAGDGANPAGIAGGRIQPFPVGLRYIVGDSHSPVLQSPSFVRWRCGQSVSTSQAPPTTTNCASSVSMEIDGPMCWNGLELDSPDHKSHMSGQVAGGGCPADHPIRLPQLQVSFTYPAAALGGMLSSDHGVGPAGRSAHYDAWFAHDPDQQDQLTRCLNDPARNSPNSPSCGVFTYDGGPAGSNPWQNYLRPWSTVIGYVKSNGDPNYGGAPPATP